jgi:hypothetical protein
LLQQEKGALVPPPAPVVTTRRSKSAALRELAKTIAHPRQARKMRKTLKKQTAAWEEAERNRNIEEFLESGRNGPRRFKCE